MQVPTCTAACALHALGGTRNRGPKPHPMLTPEIVLAAAHDAGLEPSSIVLAPVDGRGGPEIRIEPERYLYPASMLKTPLALAAYTAVADGKLRLDDVFEVGPGVMTTSDDTPLVLGSRASVEELIELMITISDNIATNMFYDILGRENATSIVRDRYGLTRTAFYRKLSGSDPLIVDPDWDREHRNLHSAGDAARTFELIAADAAPYAQTLRAVLSRQKHNDRLNPGLRPGDRFAHKTGSTDEVNHDGGILETAEGRTYVIVVYTGLPSSEESDARFAPFMKAVRAEL